MRIAIIARPWVEGALLLAPLSFLILSGWAGDDSGGIGYGTAMVAGVPAFVYVTALAGAALGIRSQLNGLAFAVALVPLLAVFDLRLYPHARPVNLVACP